MASVRVGSTRASGPRLAVVLAAAVVPYLGTLPNGFTLDDVGLVVDNPAVAAPDWAVLWGADYWAGHDRQLRSGLYRPLTLTSFALQRAVFGLDPRPYHLLNVVLHAAATGLAWRLFAPLTGAGPALWGALLFAVLPGHSEAVIAVAGRADLLAAVFALGALVVWLQPGAAVEVSAAGGAGRTLAGALLFGLALLSKEQAVVVPGLLWICHWRQRRRGAAPAGRRGPEPECGVAAGPRPPASAGPVRGGWPWPPYTAAGVVLIAYLGLRLTVLEGLVPAAVDPLDNPLVTLQGVSRLLAALAVAARYAGLLVLPRRLSADHSLAAIPVDDVPVPAVVAGLLLAAGAVWLAWGYRSRPHPLFLAVLWTVTAFAPVLNLFFPIGTIFAERLSYTPSVGFAMGLGWLLSAGSNRFPVRALGLALVLVCGLRTATRTADWRDELTLWRATVAAVPASARAHEGLGTALKARGALAEAEVAYRRAIQIYPAYDTAHYNLGLVLYATGRYAEALGHFERACRLRPGFAEAHLNRGAALFRLGRLEAARQAYQEALSLRPGWEAARTNLDQIEAARRR